MPGSFKVRPGLHPGYSVEHVVPSSERSLPCHFDVSLFVCVCIRRSKGGHVQPF